MISLMHLRKQTSLKENMIIFNFQSISFVEGRRIYYLKPTRLSIVKDNIHGFDMRIFNWDLQKDTLSRVMLIHDYLFQIK